MAHSSIEGRPAPYEAALNEAARLLAASRAPLIAGLGTDIAGARSAIRLAGTVGAVLDHMHSGALLRDLAVLREHGMMVTTPIEARRRADTVLLAGPGLAAAGLQDIWPDLAEPSLAPAGDAVGLRRLLTLGDDLPQAHLSLAGTRVGVARLLALVRARLAGRPVALAPQRQGEIDAFVAALTAARFGVAVWSAAALDELAIEMLCGLVKDLNAHTRFTGLPLAPADNAAGVLQACGWMTGYPMRTGFARGIAEHDPWRFEATRLVASGEIDCAVWISAFGRVGPPWAADIPLIALTAPGTEFYGAPQVHVAVGAPGMDHAGIVHVPRTGQLGHTGATRPNDLPSVAAVLSAIAAKLDGGARC